MRNTARYMVVILSCLSIAGCEKWLEIKPKNVLLAEDAITSPAAVQKVLTGAYDLFRDDNFMGGECWVAAELMTDNLSSDGLSGSYLAVYNRNTSLFTQTSKNLWNTGYTIIYRCNLVLDALKKVPGFTPQELARVRGEALCLRAWTHLELVRLFAQPYGYTADNSHSGIPIRIKPGTETLPRSTVAAVYNQILADLNTAVQELPADMNKGQVNVWAAKGLLARVYFHQGDFVLAYKNAKDVVENSPNIFENNLTKRFGQGGSDDNIFELSSTGNAKPGQSSGGRLISAFSSENGRPMMLYSSDFFNAAKADTSDLRYKNWLKVTTPAAGPPDEYWPTKMNTSSWFSIPVMHLAEIKLIYAESAAEQSKRIEALLQLNDIRNRAGLSDYNSLNNTDIVNEVRKQRRLEMALEGNRLHDLKRQAIRDNNAGLRIRNALWNCPGLILAIPADEMSANPKMVQNPLGGCN
ncbi:MAG: RagB/SusD family nutrient uptake outer membrane protein [Bacteroidetes bacterium]|nr:RagB/SusD family nutrient uptake outer membrane protein [Bacteroidota bacterium]